MNDDLCYIVTINYNSFQWTKNFLDSIYSSSYKNFKVLLIDNDSIDDSLDNIKIFLSKKKISSEIIDAKDLKEYSNKEIDKDLLIIKSPNNLGYGGGNNLGIYLFENHISPKYLWILNNDVTVDSKCLTNLIKNYKKKSILGTVIYDYSNKSVVQSIGAKINKIFLTTYNLTFFSHINNIDYLPGTSLFLDKNTFSKIGFFPENYFMYYEDVDWSYTAKKLNITLDISYNSFVFHNNKNKVNFNIKILSIFNRLRFCYKYFLYKMPFVLIGCLYSFFKIILKTISNK